MSEKKTESGISEIKGVEQPETINSRARELFQSRKKGRKTAGFYIEGIKRADISILSQAITLTESSLNTDKQIAREIIKACLPVSGKSLRIGITGVPGVGKSTFIESFGLKLIEKGRRVAVLAIDPSSSKSKGSILGDKTRMESLSSSPSAYIRPTPSSGIHGGVANRTAETIILCESAGFDTIFIETVGVGQSETAVKSMTDFFLLLMLAGAGDELQGIKRGIMEMADAIFITKADGDNLFKAKSACVEYKNALHLFPFPESGFLTQVIHTSSATGEGLDEAANIIFDYEKHCKTNGFFEQQRAEQAKFRMYETINEELKNSFYEIPGIKEKLSGIENLVVKGELSPYDAASLLIKMNN